MANSFVISKKTTDNSELLDGILSLKEVGEHIRNEYLQNIQFHITSKPNTIPIKSLGVYHITIHMSNDEIKIPCKLWVIAEIEKENKCPNCDSLDLTINQNIGGYVCAKCGILFMSTN